MKVLKGHVIQKGEEFSQSGLPGCGPVLGFFLPYIYPWQVRGQTIDFSFPKPDKTVTPQVGEVAEVSVMPGGRPAPPSKNCCSHSTAFVNEFRGHPFSYSPCLPISHDSLRTLEPLTFPSCHLIILSSHIHLDLESDLFFKVCFSLDGQLIKIHFSLWFS